MILTILIGIVKFLIGLILGIILMFFCMFVGAFIYAKKTPFRFNLKYDKIPIGKTKFEQFINIFKNKVKDDIERAGTYMRFFNTVEIILPVYNEYFKDGHSDYFVIKRIAECVEHEYYHKCLDKIDKKLTNNQHHYIMKKVGV